jgi:hypothetical protein
MNYPTVKFPNDTAHMLFDMGYSYGILHRTTTVLEWALTDTQDERIATAIRELLEEIEALQEGRLQAVNALYANADNAMEVLNRIVAAQNNERAGGHVC